MSENLKAYLRLVARRYCEDLSEEDDTIRERFQDRAWDELTPDERDQANDIVAVVFEEYL